MVGQFCQLRVCRICQGYSSHIYGLWVRWLVLWIIPWMCYWGGIDKCLQRPWLSGNCLYDQAHLKSNNFVPTPMLHLSAIYHNIYTLISWVINFSDCLCPSIFRFSPLGGLEKIIWLFPNHFYGTLFIRQMLFINPINKP